MNAQVGVVFSSDFRGFLFLANFGSSTLDQSCGTTEKDIRNSFKKEPFYAKSESDVLQLKEDSHIVSILSSH